MNITFRAQPSLYVAALIGCCLPTVSAQAQIVVSAVVNGDIANYGEFPQVTVDVFVNHTGELDGSGPYASLGGYQVALDVTGGDAGTIGLASNLIDDNRPGFVFQSIEFFDCTPWPFPLVCAAVTVDPWGVGVQNPGYLGTFRLLPSPDAAGVFQIRVRPFQPPPGNGTILNDADAIPFSFSTAHPDNIHANVECLDDSDCGGPSPHCLLGATPADNACVTCVVDADCAVFGNDCTNVYCGEFYTCYPSYVAAGIPCEDGLFCTASDECDGAGTCVGGADPCARAPFVQCCEATNRCLDPDGFLQCPFGN